MTITILWCAIQGLFFGATVGTLLSLCGIHSTGWKFWAIFLPLAFINGLLLGILLSSYKGG